MPAQAAATFDVPEPGDARPKRRRRKGPAVSPEQLALTLWPPDEPFIGACRVCGVEVLALEVEGREVVVEIAEALEVFACPLCVQVAGRGHRRSGCPRCNMTGWIGEELPLRGVALDAEGAASVFRRDKGRADGVAVHVLHACVDLHNVG